MTGSGSTPADALSALLWDLPAAHQQCAERQVMPTADIRRSPRRPTEKAKTGREPDWQLLHIHGYGGDPTGTLVLGHGGERRPEDNLNFKPVGPDNDWRIRDGMDHLDDYFAKTVKPTVELIAKPRSFFDDLSDVRDIFIHRHGLADADEPNFSEIIDRVDLSTMSWIVSTNGDLADRQARFGRYGIAPHLECPILIEALAGFSLTPDISI